MCDKKISIIVPVYKTEKYLCKCIQSILAQTYSDIEVICVNDGSPDRSGEILDELAKNDERIVVIHTENKGVANARNVGISVAKGDYIAFVDSDDYISQDMYKELVIALEREGADIATCNYYFDTDNTLRRIINQKEVPQIALPTDEFLIYMYERDVYKGVAAYVWTRLYRKELLKNEDDELVVKFSADITGADDVVFNEEVTRNCKSIVYVDKPLYYYVQRENSIVHSDHLTKNLAWVRAYEVLIQNYKERDIPDNVLEMIIRMYVYVCGRTLEAALKSGDIKQISVLKQKVKTNLHVYVKTNLEHLDRIRWILDLLDSEMNFGTEIDSVKF